MSTNFTLSSGVRKCQKQFKKPGWKTQWGNLYFKHYRHYVRGLLIAFLRYNWYTIYSTGFPGGLDGKESSSNAGDLGSIPGLGRSPEEGSGNPHQYSYLENPHGQRSLEGCSPWGRKESDTTEQLNHNKYMFKGYNLISFGISISQWNHTHVHVVFHMNMCITPKSFLSIPISCHFLHYHPLPCHHKALICWFSLYVSLYFLELYIDGIT